jgi:hypothetical protein
MVETIAGLPAEVRGWVFADGEREQAAAWLAE